MELSELEKHAILRTIRRMSKVEIEAALRRLVIVEIEAEKIFDFPKARMAEKIRLFIEDKHTSEKPQKYGCKVIRSTL